MQNFGNFNSFATNPPLNTAPKVPLPNNFANFSFNAPFNQAAAQIPNLNNLKLDTNLEVPQSIPKPKLKAILNNNERGYYSSLLSQADPINSNSVQGKDAVAFFKRSGLSVEILKRIWLLASSNNESLDREEFYVALKLIAYAQNNLDVSAESLAKNLTTPLPKFSSLAPEKKEEKVEEIQPNQTGIENNLMQLSNDNFKNEQPQLQMKQEQFNPNNFSQPTPLNIGTQSTMSQAFSSVQPSNSNALNSSLSTQNSQKETTKNLSDADCKINLEKLNKYEQYFKTLDANQTGLILGTEAKDIFLKSGLPTQQLFQIWKLVDTKKEGNLTKGEFMVALHLIMLARQGFQLPPELPRSLLEIINEFQPQKPMNRSGTEKSNMDLISVGEMKFDDKYSALENVEVVQAAKNNLNRK